MLLTRAKDLERMVGLVEESEFLPENGLIYKRAMILKDYMTQPPLCGGRTNRLGRGFVSLSDMVKDVSDILSRKFDQAEVDDFRYIEAIKDLKKNARKTS